MSAKARRHAPRPRVCAQEITVAHELAKRPEGVTVRQLIDALGAGATSARARLILRRLDQSRLAATALGTSAGQGANALVYRLRECHVCACALPPGREKHCSRACVVKAADRARKARERQAAG